MKPIQFVYLIILSAVAGVNAVPTTVCLSVCASAPLACKNGLQSVQMGSCWTCCSTN
ncbi:hypothetical protein BDR05DRAFT_508065 [Suillus weaverae]|nr:hypothetical protein BDR05DRAFT_508065 [Suillus weaverae]